MFNKELAPLFVSQVNLSVNSIVILFQMKREEISISILVIFVTYEKLSRKIKRCRGGGIQHISMFPCLLCIRKLYRNNTKCVLEF